MILFDGNSLTPRTKFQAEKLSLQLTERSSTASMTVKDTAPTMAIGDWLKIEDGPGSDIVWRVKTIDEQFEKHTRTISMEHMINSLKDKIIFDEVKSEYISGQEGVNPTNADTIRFILEEFQRDWVLGGVAGGNVRNPYTFNGDTLYSALGTVTNSIEDSFWQYDMSRYPFRIDIGHLTGQVSSEMRMDRNIRTIKRTIDRTGMFTKFFPVGKNNLHIIGDSVDMNTDLYGVICKSETDQSKDTEAELNRWAHDRIRRHCEPTVTITISGLDLAKATGESLDAFHIGYLCRVPLPEYNTTILERITKLSYSDVISDPMNVTVTLANNLEDVASIISNMSSTASTSSKAAATKAGEDHAWIEDTEDHVAIVAEALIGPDENGVNWSRVSSIVVDGQGIHQQVVKAQGDIIANSAKIDINENRILQEVTDRTNADGELQGRITVQADRITQEVTNRQRGDSELSGRITVTAREIRQEVTDTENRLSARIKVNSDEIELKVNKNGVVSAINQTAEEVKIQAAKINLSGYVTASELSATNGRIDNLMSGNTTATKIVCDDLRLPTAFYYHGNRYTEFYSSTEKKYLLGRS
jgi:phage minor structural protein